MEIIEDAAGIHLREAIPRVIPVASPAVGTDPTFPIVPTGSLWIPLSVIATLTTSATVASRVPALRYSDSTTVFSAIPSGNSIAASIVAQITWGRGMGALGSVTPVSHIAPLPMYPLPGGYQLSMLTNAIQAGDQWSAVAVCVIEVEELPYDVELNADIARLRGMQSNAIPDMREGL